MSDIKDIKLNVEKIQKRFGNKIKMPNENDEELDVMELLLQGIGTALFGTYKKDEGGIKTLFQNRKLSIYEITKQIKINSSKTYDVLSKNIPTITTDISDIKRTLSDSNKTNLLFDILTGIESIEKTIQLNSNANNNLNFDDLSNSISDLKNIINSLNSNQSNLNITIDDHNTIKALKDLTNTLNRVNGEELLNNFINGLEKISTLEKIDTSLLKEKIKMLNSILNDTGDNSINTLYVNISRLSRGSFKTIKDIQNVNDTINTIITLLNIQEVNSQSLYKLAFLTSKNGPINEVINNLRKYSSIPNDVQKSLVVLDELFKSLITISDIGFFQRRRISRNLNFINQYILKELPNVFNNLKTTSALSENTIKSIENLEEVFKLISNISNFELTNKNRLTNNLDFIQNELIKKISNIIISLYISANEITKNTDLILDSANNIKNIIDAFIEISNVDENKIDDIIYSIDYINNELINSIISLMKSVESISTSGCFENISNINFVFESLNTITNQLPSFKDILLNSIKLSGLRSLLENDINDIINYVLILQNIPKDKLDIFIKELPILFNSLNSINAKLNVKDFVTIFKNLKSFNKELILLDDILKYVRNINGTIQFDILKQSFIDDIIYGLSDIETQLDKMDFTNEMKNLNALVDELNMINKIVAIDKILAKNLQTIDYESIKEYIDNDLKLFVMVFTDKHDIGKNIKNLVKLNKKDLENIDILIDALKSLNRLTKISISSKLTEAGMNAMENAVSKMINIVNEIKDIDNSDVEKAKEFINSFTALIATSGAVMILGALLMSKIKMTDLVLFTVSLTFFVGSVLTVFRLFSKGIKNELEGAKDCLLLISGAGLIMTLGSLMMHVIDPKDLFKFVITLSTFILGVGTALLLGKFGYNAIKDSAKDAMTIVGSAALIMMFGSLMYKYIPSEDLQGFIFNLSFFIGSTGLILLAAAKGIKSIKRSAVDFIEIVGSSALIMMLGALAYHYISFADLFGFTFMLSAFIFGVSFSFIMFNKNNKNVFKGATELAILVGVSAGILLVGAKLLKPEDYLNLAVFAVVLAAFTGGLVYIYNKASKDAPQAIIGSLAIALLTAISGGILLYAGKQISENPDILTYAFGFGVGLLGYTWLMIELSSLASKNQSKIFGGLLAMGGILAVTYAGIKVINTLLETFNGVDKWTLIKSLVKGVGAMYAVIGAIGTGAIGIGLLLGGGTLGIGAGTLAIGLAAIYSIAEVTDVVTNVIDNMYKKMKNIDVNGLELMKDNMLSSIKVIGEVQTSMLNEFGVKRAAKIWVCAKSFKETGLMLNTIAKAIKDWSDLRIVAEYDSNGNPIRYLSLGEGDFTRAAENIKAVLLAIGTAIIDTYDNAKDTGIFDDATKLGLLDSPFTRIVKSMRYAGDMLSSIGKAIKDWSDLRIVSKYDKNGNPIEYMSLGDGDFTRAATNINKVLVAIGTSITETVKDHQDLFGDNIFTDSPAINAAKAMKLMGDVLNNTALTVSYYANGEFPIFDKNGKIIDKIKLGENDISNAKDKIKNVLMALGEAIVDVVKNPNNADIFKDGMITDSPAIVASKAIATMANGINTMVSVLNKLEKINSKNINLVNVKRKIKSLLEGSISIMQLFTANSDNSRSGLRGALNFIWKGGLTVGDYINENLPNVINAANAINKLVNSIIKVINNVSSLGETMVKNETNLSIIKDKSFKENIEHIFGVLNIINSVVKDIDLSNKNDLFDLFDSYAKILDRIVATVNNFNSDSVNYLDLLEKGIIKLYSTTSNIENIGAFNQYVHDVKEFVEAVNSLDINKLSTMNNLTESLNRLANKLGNMDDLVDVLANKVTMVLLELVNQLNHAEKVINNAHELQKRRKKLIDESVVKVKEIMKQNMIVKIGKLDEGTTLSTPNMNNGNSSNGNSGNSTSYDNNKELESPEEVTNGNKKNVTNVYNQPRSNSYGEKPLTAEEFNKLMRDHMKGWDG